MRFRKRRNEGHNLGAWGDVEYDWGDGCSKSDGHLLHAVVNSPRHWVGFEGAKVNPSLLEELVSRGYDITTLRFSIAKKVAPTTPKEPR